MGGWLVSFRLAVTPSAIVMALLLTLGMGLIGGLFPAIRAASCRSRQPCATNSAGRAQPAFACAIWRSITPSSTSSGTRPQSRPAVWKALMS